MTASDSLVIRPAEEGDIAAVVRIESESFADPWTAESFRSSLVLGQMEFLVAESAAGDDGGRGGRALVGYVIALVAADEGEIADLAVSPSARRQGIGAMLLDRVSVAAAERGVRALYLEVRESNVAARRLYESRFFLPVGRRVRYYSQPVEDALLLRRDLAAT